MYKMFVLISLFTAVSVATAADEDVLMRFSGPAIPPGIEPHNVKASVTTWERRPVLRVDFGVADWPNVMFIPESGTWDWNRYSGIRIRVINPGDAPVDAYVRVDNAGADGHSHCVTGSVTVAAGEAEWLTASLPAGDGGQFWGMRGTPLGMHAGQKATFDPAKITAFQVFLARPEEPHTLLIREIRLVEGTAPKNVPMPFIDAFGQYKHADWPGKLGGEREFQRRIGEEEQALRRHSQLPGRDRFGGWADGPQLTATGWFRTEQVNGKWWLVTPEGRLFLSMGVNCLHPGDSTFVDGRDGWFEALPAAHDARLGSAYGHAGPVHSMAERIGGKGRTFNFYQANLIRKYGENWFECWRDSSYARLKSWGFTTIGNWSDWRVLQRSDIPFMVSIGSGSVREIEGARGYWGRMKDVFDPQWPQVADEAIQKATAPFKDNPLAIGYFVDNESSWETVRKGTLASPLDQPCRQALIADLQAQYGGIEQLNQAWGTDAPSWDALRAPEPANPRCTADLDAFEYRFARRYFDAILNALRRHAPHQLYLGCRFATSPPMAVKACADVADVVSFNRYTRTIKSEHWTGLRDLGKPLIIGEFHFGALDRGMFHTGLVAAENQRERANRYVDYVRSVTDCPAFVGCHWFQYMDQPTTGRCHDGENYNIGLVTITDTPYPELTAAARRVHEEMYRRRYKMR